MGIRYAVIGAGLVGGSIALRLQREGHDVVVYDSDDQTRLSVRARGIDVVTLAQLRDADVVVFAVPTDAVADVVAAVGPHLRPGAVVTDVASVKAPVRAAFTSLGQCRIVLSHPMAGAATTGFGHADASLFDGCSWVVCAQPGEPGYDAIAELASVCGAGRVVSLDPDEHDHAVASVSHVVQLVSSALTAAVGSLRDGNGFDVLQVAGTGWRDTTRLAGSSAQMWAPILTANAAEVVPVARRVISVLEQLCDAIDADDSDAISAVFGEANITRAAWEQLRR